MKAKTPRTSSSCKEAAAGAASVAPAAAGLDSRGRAGSPARLYRPRLGLEIEMVVAHARTGASLPVEAYFSALREVKQERGVSSQDMMQGGRCIGLHTATAECGLDNGFNLLETALAPVDDGPRGLDRLAALAHRELADTLQALEADEACILNASQHPDCPRDAHWYAKVCVPRPIYRELRDHRGWHHWEGIDAKAQNGANTSVPVEGAIRALNVAIALAPASLALFANSPLESGRDTGLRENRMTIWPRVFGPARFPGDAWLCQYPSRPFHDLGDFFHWMFGAGTVARGLPLAPSYDYKSVPTVLLEGDPCLEDFLTAPAWRGRRSDDGSTVELVPHARHFEYSQIGQFLDARLRYRLDAEPPLAELLDAWRRDGGLETLFAACGAQTYIEARAPGAGFADECLLREAGPAQALSLLPAPSAVQKGLLANLDEAWRLVNEWGWQALGELREPAMRTGVGDGRVKALCAQVLSVARSGLAPHDASWLAYPEFVLDSGRSGADRLLDTWNSAGGTARQRLAALLAHHAAVQPGRYGGI
ncbi:glutamate-cysteine ligase family protein [Pollutimonas sp. M17]|nr:glutamate-cysteine ligase family protein [Pollutimonas sp. M17]UYO93405.1 glutamate-cysteine ligase family protein [Pollutimonas sp. M17]